MLYLIVQLLGQIPFGANICAEMRSAYRSLECCDNSQPILRKCTDCPLNEFFVIPPSCNNVIRHHVPQHDQQGRCYCTVDVCGFMPPADVSSPAGSPSPPPPQVIRGQSLLSTCYTNPDEIPDPNFCINLYRYHTVQSTEDCGAQLDGGQRCTITCCMPSS